MSALKDRENAFENKFAHDETMRFKAKARRNKLLARWAAQKLGLSSVETEAYAVDLLRSVLAGPDEDVVFRKLSNDLGNLVYDATLRHKMRDLLVDAKAQLVDEADS